MEVAPRFELLKLLTVFTQLQSKRAIMPIWLYTRWLFYWSALKKCHTTCKSLKKSSKCQNFLRIWHLVIFRADQ